MAEQKVIAQTADDGTISVGVKVDGVFVPIASRAPGSVASLVEGGKATADDDGGNDNEGGK